MFSSTIWSPSIPRTLSKHASSWASQMRLAVASRIEGTIAEDFIHNLSDTHIARNLSEFLKSAVENVQTSDAFASTIEDPGTKGTHLKSEFNSSQILDLETRREEEARLLDSKEVNPFTSIPYLSEQFDNQTFVLGDIVTDKFDRVPEVFKVPEDFQKRVTFWASIYAVYGSHVSLVHHSEYPWIVFDKIDIRDIYSGSGHKWTRYHKAKSVVSQRVATVKKALTNLSSRKNYRGLKGLEAQIYNQLKEIKGNRKAVIREALNSVRAQKGQKDFFKSGLENSQLYLTQMEEIFAHNDMPVELTRLPLVESSFNTKAMSKVGASGIWQFMPVTGKKKALHVGDHVDERNSPLKATVAAAKLLKENYRIFKSWPLALTAYNHGAGNLLKAIKQTRSRDLINIIEKVHLKSFGFASSNFYAEYLAALHVQKYSQEIFGTVFKSEPLVTEQIILSQRMRPKTIAVVAGLNLEELRFYNPDLKSTALTKNVTLPRSYSLHLPPGKVDFVKSYQEKLKLTAKLERSETPKKSQTRRALSRKRR